MRDPGSLQCGLQNGRLRLGFPGEEQRRQRHTVELRQSFVGRPIARRFQSLGAGRHQPAGVHDVFGTDPPKLHGIGGVSPVHLAHGHLTIAAEIVLAGAFEAARDTAHLHRLIKKKAALQPLRITTDELLRVSIEQLQQQILPIRRQREYAAVGVDRLALRSLGEIVDHDVVHLVRIRIAAGDPHEELVRDRIHRLVPQGERRLGLRDIALQDAQLVVGARQDLVVERHHRDRQQERTRQHRQHQGADTHAVRLEGGDLVFGGHTAEGVQGRHQHGHRHRHRDGEWQREDEEFTDGRPGKSLAGEICELARDVLQHEQRRQRGQRKQERSDVLAHDIAGNKLHDVNSSVTTRIIKGASA